MTTGSLLGDGPTALLSDMKPFSSNPVRGSKFAEALRRASRHYLLAARSIFSPL